jgi:hypothetical protein
MSNAVINPDLIFDATKNVVDLAEGKEFERVGSLIFWDFPDKLSINHNFSEIEKVFAGTLLKDYIQSVGLSECIRRFADSVVTQHGTLYGRQLSYLTEKDKNNPGHHYLVFYTGKVDDKKSTNFKEHCKIWIGDGGQNIALLNQDSQFLIQHISELIAEFKKHWQIIPKDVMSALGDLANNIGYRFNSHGGHYFVPHKFTDELYKIKSVLKEFNQKLSITPLIAGCDEDIEEIVNVLGGEFKKELDEAEKALFEQCIQIYNYQPHWDDYVDAVLHKAIEEVKANRISKTRYGKKITAKIVTLAENASDGEYKSLVKSYISGIKPNKNKSISKLYSIRDRLRTAVDKLDFAAESKLINKWRNKILEDLFVVNQQLQKTSELLLDEVLSVL